MTDFRELRERYRSFVEERDWTQFHTPKNLAMAISVEANELLELFLWHSDVDAERVQSDEDLMADVQNELADVVIYCLGLANQLEIDLLGAIEDKMDENERRFDADAAEEITAELRPWQTDSE